MRQSVRGLREDGRWVIAVSHIAVAVVALVVTGSLVIAALTARAAQSAAGFDGTESARADSPTSPAVTQVMAGFGLLSFWFIAGAVLVARANPGRKLVFGTPTHPDTSEDHDSNNAYLPENSDVDHESHKQE